VGSDLPAQDRAEGDERDDDPIQVGECGEDDRGGGVGRLTAPFLTALITCRSSSSPRASSAMRIDALPGTEVAARWSVPARVSGGAAGTGTASPRPGVKQMTTDSEDATTRSGAGAEHEPASTPADTTSSPQSPYDIGLAADEDETGPKPLDTDLEDKQVEREA
jgi:hypothetical protein